MNKYRTPNGNILTEEELLNQYGAEKFQEFLNQGKLNLIQDEDVPVSEEIVNDIFVTPNGNELTQQELINQYGEQKFNTFVSDGKVKKKSIPNQVGSTSELADSQLEPFDIGGESTEKDTAIERIFGKNVVTDLFGDLYRAGAAGQAQGGSIDESLELFAKGASASDEDIQDFIAAQQRMQEAGESDEMRSFSEIYQDNGGGVLGFIKGVARNPTVIPQLFVSSVSAMLNPTVLGGAAAGGALGAGVGAAGFNPFTVGGGAIVGAIGGASTTLEAGLTYAELLQE